MHPLRVRWEKENNQQKKRRKRETRPRQRDFAETILHQHPCAPISTTEPGYLYQHIISYLFIPCRIAVMAAARRYSHLWRDWLVSLAIEMQAHYLAHGLLSKQESEASKVIYFVQGGDEEMRKGTSMARR
jgi:hypothetical protein